MLKTVVFCDFCEKPLSRKERNNIYLYRTKEFDTHKLYPHMCMRCANQIDDILMAYKEDAAHKASLASMFAQINAERRERLGTEG